MNYSSISEDSSATLPCAPIFCAPLTSSFGDILILWEGQDASSLCRIYLPKDVVAQFDRARVDFPHLTLWEKGAALPSAIESIAELLHAILAGRPVQLPFAILEKSLRPLGVFQQKVLMLEATIPFGHISTYRELARASGNSLAFRAVARALSHNPLPLLIPCHRVIASNGSLAGYQGGTAMKQHLLELEGIPFSSEAVDLKRAKLWNFSA
ncbi:MAG: MGMT family protein [Rectinema sp.]|jgi:methylated-DNA-[protein]-cysteine S-methyltransferase